MKQANPLLFSACQDFIEWRVFLFLFSAVLVGNLRRQCDQSAVYIPARVTRVGKFLVSGLHRPQAISQHSQNTENIPLNTKMTEKSGAEPNTKAENAVASVRAGMACLDA